jgi:hypothetical protein
MVPNHAVMEPLARLSESMVENGWPFLLPTWTTKSKSSNKIASAASGNSHSTTIKNVAASTPNGLVLMVIVSI